MELLRREFDEGRTFLAAKGPSGATLTVTAGGSIQRGGVPDLFVRSRDSGCYSASLTSGAWRARLRTTCTGMIRIQLASVHAGPTSGNAISDAS